MTNAVIETGLVDSFPQPIYPTHRAVFGECVPGSERHRLALLCESAIGIDYLDSDPQRGNRDGLGHVLIPSHSHILDGHCVRVSLKLDRKVKDRLPVRKMFGYCLAQVVGWHCLGMNGWFRGVLAHVPYISRHALQVRPRDRARMANHSSR